MLLTARRRRALTIAPMLAASIAVSSLVACQPAADPKMKVEAAFSDEVILTGKLPDVAPGTKIFPTVNARGSSHYPNESTTLKADRTYRFAFYPSTWGQSTIYLTTTGSKVLASGDVYIKQRIRTENILLRSQSHLNGTTATTAVIGGKSVKAFVDDGTGAAATGRMAIIPGSDLNNVKRRWFQGKVAVLDSGTAGFTRYWQVWVNGVKRAEGGVKKGTPKSFDIRVTVPIESIEIKTFAASGQPTGSKTAFYDLVEIEP
jgi:hypothetical protein